MGHDAPRAVEEQVPSNEDTNAQQVIDTVDSQADVASLVHPVDDAAPAVAKTADGTLPAYPDATTDDVKNLVPPDAPAAALTGAIDVSVHRPRIRRPHLHIPHVRRPHMPARVRTFDSFRYRNYVLLWLATGFSSGGFWLQQVIVGWLAYQVTQSAFWTSLALGLDALPILFIGPLGGLLVDRFNRRKLLAAIYAYQALVTTCFASVVLLGSLQPWHIFAFIFFMGLAWVVSDPARMSLISNTVPRENLVNAFALNSMAFSVTRLAAPAIGGVLIVTVGAGLALVLEMALQCGAVVMALGLRLPAVRSGLLRPRQVFSDLVEGFRYARSKPVLLILFGLTALPAMLVMPSIQGLMPVYAAEVFGVDARGLGILLSAIGAGSTLGTFVLASIGDLSAKGTAIVSSILLVALATLAFSVNSNFQTAYINLMVLSGATMTFFSVSNAVIQGTVSDEFRGRVSGLYMITWGLFPIGSLATGYLAEQLGAPHATQIASGTLLIVFGIGAWRFRRLWRRLDHAPGG